MRLKEQFEIHLERETMDRTRLQNQIWKLRGDMELLMDRLGLKLQDIKEHRIIVPKTESDKFLKNL